MKKIDIVVPCYNESENIRPLYQAIKDVFTKELPDYDFNLLLVNDGSKDSSLLVLQQLAKEDERVKYLSFSRNFGHQLAVKAGLDHAFAPAVISMDADLQHPPTLIPTLVRKWEEGAQVVATLRTYPAEISKKKRKSSQQFYKLLNLLSDIEIKEGSADFRLLDQSVVEVIRHMRENEPFLRGMVPWVGFKQVYVPYTAQARYSGETKYTLKKMFQLALSGVTSFSVKPLYFAVFLDNSSFINATIAVTTAQVDIDKVPNKDKQIRKIKYRKRLGKNLLFHNFQQLELLTFTCFHL